MALFECNIDARGKAVRLKLGIRGLVAGFVLATALYFAEIDGGILWLITLGIAGGGAFAIFESMAGWCVVRALGFRTPL
ncbi:MAG: hypothetical protein NZ802_07400 [Candidatus Poseidoniales archaeon]|nr:hypothetical protein [Candidatus Poseidoniales archaeon]